MATKKDSDDRISARRNAAAESPRALRLKSEIKFWKLPNAAGFLLPRFCTAAALVLKIKLPPPKIDLEAIRVINEINKNFRLLLKLLETGHNVDTTMVDQYFRILAGLKLVIMEKQ